MARAEDRAAKRTKLNTAPLPLVSFLARRMSARTETGRSALTLKSLRLDPGAHESPRHGVCIVELASVIAHERFSDRPDCVCEVIAAFLRSWNDRSSHAERQRLIPYARRIVGSRAGPRVTRLRRDMCLSWAGADLTGNAVSRFAWRTAMRARILVLCGLRPALRLNQGAGELAARAVFGRHDPETALRLVSTLLSVGAPSGPPHPNGNGGANPDGVELDLERARALVERAVQADASTSASENADHDEPALTRSAD